MHKISKAELKKARERLNLKENRGTDEEYRQHMLKIFYELKPLRDRVNAICLK